MGETSPASGVVNPPLLDPADEAYPGSPTDALSPSYIKEHWAAVANSVRTSFASTVIPPPVHQASNPDATADNSTPRADPTANPTSPPDDTIHASLPPADAASHSQATISTFLDPNQCAPSPPSSYLRESSTSLKSEVVSEEDSADRIVFADFVAVNPAARHLLDLVFLQQQHQAVDYDSERHLYSLALNRDESKQSWTIGASPDSDIVLCPSALGAAEAREFIAEHHALLRFHQGSGFLLIEALSSKYVFCNSTTHIAKKNSGPNQEYDSIYAISSRCCRLVFGSYHFELRFKNLGPTKHKELVRLHRRHIKLREYSFALEFLDPIPSISADQEVRAKLSNGTVIAKRMSTSTRSGLNPSTGEALVIKTIDYTHSTAKDKSRQGSVYRLLQDRALPGTAQLTEMLWNDLEGFTLLQAVMPMATYNLRIFFSLTINRQLTADQIFEHLYLTARGLHAFHGNNIIHGNITPDTLLVYPDGAENYTLLISPIVSPSITSPLQSSIFIAPEVSPIFGGYSEKSDVWSLAMSWVSSITGFLRIPVHCVSPEDAEDALATLTNDGRFNESFILLVRRMLAAEPHDRLHISQVVHDKAWTHRNPEKNKRKDVPLEPPNDLHGARAGKRLQTARAKQGSGIIKKGLFR
ncbi:kinase-like domain-containing protein [Trichoderma sp. SZMC 28014]